MCQRSIRSATGRYSASEYKAVLGELYLIMNLTGSEAARDRETRKTTTSLSVLDPRQVGHL